ncbi:MAG TPA: HAMP domain-containing sensor histidine kinase [Candidatus Limnocylindria bacterium]|jgi:two-component system OmpR family sensor kinase|nr:HAMP domain-containing sensor histidine kinase [Candidatus Limnocylindria bacterium]
MRSAERYAAWPVLVCIALVLLGTAGAIRILAVYGANAVAEDARATPALYRVYRARYPNLAEAGPQIARALTRNGIRAVVFSHDGEHAYGPTGELRRPGTGRAMHPPGEGDRFAMLVALVGGSTRALVPVGDAEVGLMPDPVRVGATARLLAGVGLVLIVVVAIALWTIARAVTAAATRPLVETTEALWGLAGGDFTPRMIVADARSDIGRLARAYNAAAETVARAIEERRAAQAEMQRFIADAGHELRTPLTVVMGFVDVLEGARVPPDVGSRIFTSMRAETRRMRGLIDKLITLVRLESPRDEAEREPIAMRAVAERVIQGLTSLADGRSVRVDARADAWVRADEHELFDALANCVENALKYAPESDVAITVEQQDGCVAVRIADRGPGMTAQERQRAFERFARGDLRGEVSGSGLGLAIVKRAVERAGGTVGLESAPGEGTCVTLTLPAARVPLARVAR